MSKKFKFQNFKKSKFVTFDPNGTPYIVIVLLPNFFKNVKYSNFNMEQPNDDVFKKISDEVYEQLKDFDYEDLTEEQESLVDKLILDKELNFNYKWYGLCKKCKQPKNSDYWCRLCVFQNFQN